MKKWTEDELIKEGYRIRNAKITGFDLVPDHECLTMFIWLDANNFHCGISGYCLGHGYPELSNNSGKVTGSIARAMDVAQVMNVIGIEKLSQIEGKYIRIVDEGLGKSISIFGNIIDDKWFDTESFFAEGE